MPGHDIIVIGASAGGVEALVTLVGTLPRNIPAAIFVVLHIPAQSPSLLPSILNRCGHLHAVQPVDGASIQHGYIYVAPPDHHLLIKHEYIRIVHGPKENRHRPAIDPLFRSAAQFYGPRVVGVILTGSLDDGTAGLSAIKRQGGIAVVQDPDEAFYPSMPLSALKHNAVDYTLPLAKIGPTLAQLASKPAGEEVPAVPEDMELETRISEMDPDALNGEAHAGNPSVFSCPECGGVLWELEDGDILRFRCRVGHAFSVDNMLVEQSASVEEALWAALKTMQESISLSRRIARRARERGQDGMAMRFEEKVLDAEQHAKQIRELLMTGERVPTKEGNASK